MHTLISNNYSIIISILTLFVLIFLGCIFIVKERPSKLNWSIFYASLYISITLPIANFLCVHFGLWNFIGRNAMLLPFDLYFLWVVLWGIIPFYFLRGRYLPIISIVIFWVDILLMPELEKFGVLQLNHNWYIGELILVGLVFIPAYYWAYLSYVKKHLGVRAIFQVIVMAAFFLVGLPFILTVYNLIDEILIKWRPYLLQIFLIIVFPSLVAVNDLVKKGKGTPFPYDPTKYLVRTGIYAYCKNPIQWSFTFMFLPLSFYYSSSYFLLGILCSIAYVVGISDYQEYPDMEERFGAEWIAYKKNVPKWWFSWKPKTIPKGEVFFDLNCVQCNQIRQWFLKAKAINLTIRSAQEFPKGPISQVTYIDHNGLEFKSVTAIACCLEHINLIYASLGWFMRFPLINYLLQAIVDTMIFGDNERVEA